jgi:hypothetical protein
MILSRYFQIIWPFLLRKQNFVICIGKKLSYVGELSAQRLGKIIYKLMEERN